MKNVFFSPIFLGFEIRCCGGAATCGAVSDRLTVTLWFWPLHPRGGEWPVYGGVVGSCGMSFWSGL